MNEVVQILAAASKVRGKSDHNMYFCRHLDSGIATRNQWRGAPFALAKGELALEQLSKAQSRLVWQPAKIAAELKKEFG